MPPAQAVLAQAPSLPAPSRQVTGRLYVPVSELPEGEGPQKIVTRLNALVDMEHVSQNNPQRL